MRRVCEAGPPGSMMVGRLGEFFELRFGRPHEADFRYCPTTVLLGMER